MKKEKAKNLGERERDEHLKIVALKYKKTFSLLLIAVRGDMAGASEHHKGMSQTYG